MTGPHDVGDLGAHALGLLDGASARAVEQHLRQCADCREEWSELRATAELLDAVPPEMFLDGPPENELVLRRTLRQVRAEATGGRRTQRLRLLAAAAAALVVLVGGGAVVGRVTAPQPVVVAAPAGTRTLDGTAAGPAGPVTMSVTVVPATGWVRVSAQIRGIPAGERCSLVVLARDGSENVAGSWVVGVPGPAGPSAINGSAIVPPEDVVAVSVRNEAGTDFITLQA